MQTNKQNLNRFSLLFGLLVFLPIVITLFTLNHTINNLAALEIAQVSDLLTNKSELIAGKVHAEAFLTPIFTRFSKKYLELEETDISSLQKITEDFSREAGVKIDVYAFNSTGQMIPTNLYPKSTEELIIFFWQYINGLKTSLDYEKIKPPMQRELGKDFERRSLIGKEGKILSYNANNKTGMLYYYRHKAAGQARGFFLRVINLPNHNNILIKSFATFQFKDTSLAIQLNQGQKKLLVKAEDKQLSEEVLEKMATENLSSFAYKGRIWKKTNIADFSVLASRASNEDYYESIKLLAILVAIALFIMALLLTHKHFFSEKQIWISIRIKLILVFIFAVYLPLLGLFFLSFKGLQDRRTVLENEARKGMLDVLYQLDTDFSKKEEQILERIDLLFKDNSWQEKLTEDWSKNDVLIRNIIKQKPGDENFFNWVEIRNNKLEQLHCSSKGAANNRVKSLNRVMAQISLEKFAPETISPESRKVRQSDLITRNIIENPVVGFNHFFEVPGQLVPMEFEGSFLYWYWNYYKIPKGDVVFFACNTKALFNANEYLEKSLQRRFSLGNTSLKVVSFHPNAQKWFPQNFDHEESLVNLKRLCALNNRITSTWINFDGKKFLATCFPGIKMRKVFLTCLYPIAEIDSKIDLLRQQIYMGMFLILIFSVLTGLLLTRTFLKPVGELNQGLTALHLRQTDFRVKINNNDEFGELGETFNQMMVEVKEMLLAGAVQQCLIPTTPPKIPGFQLVIHNQMATDVGGDYADAFILPDNKFLLVLGDVTGHGVSSSILTAMVKALIFRFSQSPTDLTLILRQLSEMIFDLLKHRKLMTFCAIIVDQATGEFALANAGHPYPIIATSEGQTRQVEHSSLPLGVSKKRSNYPTINGVLNEGDSFVMYTDGIAEAEIDGGKIFGFDRMERIVGENCLNTSEELKENLLNEFWHLYTKEMLDDDLTFVLLKREPTAVS